jgi:hypothetical protein
MVVTSSWGVNHKPKKTTRESGTSTERTIRKKNNLNKNCEAPIIINNTVNNIIIHDGNEILKKITINNHRKKTTDINKNKLRKVLPKLKYFSLNQQKVPKKNIEVPQQNIFERKTNEGREFRFDLGPTDEIIDINNAFIGFGKAINNGNDPNNKRFIHLNTCPIERPEEEENPYKKRILAGAIAKINGSESVFIEEDPTKKSKKIKTVIPEKETTEDKRLNIKFLLNKQFKKEEKLKIEFLIDKKDNNDKQ